MSNKIGSGVRFDNHGLGRRILKFKTQFADATWTEVGRRFGVSAEHAALLARISSEIPKIVVNRIGVFKCKAILNGKVPKNHLRAIYSIAQMTEEKELRRLVHKLYGDPTLRAQIDSFGCIVCATPIDFDRMATMQCKRCDGDDSKKHGLKFRFQARGELCLA